ncbi:IscS subfamily cysteine desulfurase [Bacillaceae bacterium S4-13-58]
MKYFDYAATCPIVEEALEAYIKTAKNYYGNTSSLHDIGGKAKAFLEICRKEMANLIGINETSLYFTSGGTESNVLAIHSLLSAPLKEGKHIVASMGEHSSILNFLVKLEEEGYSITLLPYQKDGTIDIDDFSKSIQKDTILAIVQHANGEVGTIQPIEQIGDICNKYKILLHTDCVQSFGKISVKEIIPYVSSLSISGHKIYGPKGIGAVYVNPSLEWRSFLPQTTHENGFRAGTVNLPAIAGFTVAASQSMNIIQEQQARHEELRNLFKENLESFMIPYSIIESDNRRQIPSIIGLMVDRLEGQWLMLELNRLGFAISTGSACQVGKQSPSSTIIGTGVSPERAKQFVRISFGKYTTKNDILELTHALHTIFSSY